MSKNSPEAMIQVIITDEGDARLESDVFYTGDVDRQLEYLEFAMESIAAFAKTLGGGEKEETASIVDFKVH